MSDLFEVSNKAPKVFFAYSYGDMEILKPIFREVSKSLRISPIFVDESVEIGDYIYDKIRKLLISSDLIVAEISSYNMNVFYEISFTEMLNKPIITIAKKGTEIPFNIHKYRIIFYENSHDLYSKLSSSILEFINIYYRKQYQKMVLEEHNLIDTIKNSMKNNVMILGKDSDEEGIKKIYRIEKILRNNGYEPIILRNLPEIKSISLEGKMIRVGGHCRFIIAEDSRPSGHIDELKICIFCEYVTATVKQVGTGSTWMQAHYPSQYKYMNRFCYFDGIFSDVEDELCIKRLSTLEDATKAAIDWAETIIQEREKIFGSQIYR